MQTVSANGAAIPAIGLGTWTLRGKACTELVVEALARGYRHIDTAVLYDNEAAVGDGIRGAGVPRDAVFLTTKVWHTELAPVNLVRSAEESLNRLKLDYVDLLLLHWPNPQVPLAATMEALNGLRERGLTRHIGVANFPTALLAEARRASAAPLACDQVEHHPYLDQKKVLAACRAAGMAMVSYCPLYRGGPLFEEAAILGLAARLGRSPAQIVLRWHVQQDGVVAIPRTTHRARLAENAAVFDFALSSDEMAAIGALGRRNKRLCEFGFANAPAWD